MAIEMGYTLRRTDVDVANDLRADSAGLFAQMIYEMNQKGPIVNFIKDAKKPADRGSNIARSEIIIQVLKDKKIDPKYWRQLPEELVPDARKPNTYALHQALCGIAILKSPHRNIVQTFHDILEDYITYCKSSDRIDLTYFVVNS